MHNKSENIDDEYKYDYFIITKENYGVYRLFEELYDDIENINIFSVEDYISFLFEEFDEEEEKRKYLEKYKKQIEEDKIRYRLYNRSNYNELFSANKEIITWYSDEAYHNVANILKIKKEEDIFKIKFYTQSYIEGYDDFHFLGYIPIRFRNSGSSYDPFNMLFMKMYNNMQQIDDVTDIGHQIYIEEYLYTKEKAKKLTKSITV